MKRSLASFTLFLSLVTGLPVTGSFAQEMKFASHRDFTKSPMFKELNLTDEQKTQIKQIHERSHDNFEKNHEAVKAAKGKLEEGMANERDDHELKERFQAFQKAHSELMKLRFEQALAIRKILTPEQRKQFREIRQRMFERMHRHGDSNPSEQP